MCGDKVKCANCGTQLRIVVNASIMIIGFALISMGVWLLVNGDSTYYTQLTRFQTPVATSSSAPADSDWATNKEVTFSAAPKSSAMTSHAADGDDSSMVLSQWLVLIVAGSCIVVAGFIGCCGACAEKRVWLLASGSILTALLVVAEATLIGLDVGLNPSYSHKLLKNLKNQVSHHYNITARPPGVINANVDQLTLAWNSLQTELKCCGASNPDDYRYSAWFNSTPNTEGMFVPVTCCRQKTNTDPGGPRLVDDVDLHMCQLEAILHMLNSANASRLPAMHGEGCHSALMRRLDAHRHTVVGLLTIIVVLQIVDMFFASLIMRVFCARNKNSKSTRHDVIDDDVQYSTNGSLINCKLKPTF